MSAPYEGDGTLFPGYGDPEDPIDPDQLLEQIRRVVSEYLDTYEGLSDAEVEDLARTFDLLDGWISTGGQLPEPWRRRSTGRGIEVVRFRGHGEPPLLHDPHVEGSVGSTERDWGWSP